MRAYNGMSDWPLAGSSATRRGRGVRIVQLTPEGSGCSIGFIAEARAEQEMEWRTGPKF